MNKANYPHLVLVLFLGLLQPACASEDKAVDTSAETAPQEDSAPPEDVRTSASVPVSADPGVSQPSRDETPGQRSSTSPAGSGGTGSAEPLEDAYAGFAEMDPLDLYERMSESEEALKANRGEAELAAARVRDYSDYIRALTAEYPPRGKRSLDQENLLMELETLRGAADYLRRDHARQVREREAELAAIRRVMTVSEVEGVDELLVSVDIPGRPTMTKRIPVEDELDVFFKEQKQQADAERTGILKSFRQYMKDTSNLRTETLVAMKTNRERFMEELDRNYEITLSARQAQGRPTAEIEPPPGYEERHPERSRQPPKAIPAKER
ncbi:MAG: hypothetical protein GVY36_14605 [Verrucomicrobia bacterium]|jgi:hypothetical protein|nr:hypothetical protein [Verrucomicrobiota bacterium]